MNLIRKYKLSKLGIKNFTETENININSVIDKLSGLSKYIPEEEYNFDDSIWYMDIKGKWIFEFTSRNKSIFFNYVEFYDYINNDLDQWYLFIKFLVEEKYKIQIGNVRPVHQSWGELTEHNYKKELKNESGSKK